MNRIIKIAIVAAILIFIAAYLFFYNSEGTTKVVVVESEINEATEITSGMVTVKNLPVSVVPKNAIRNIDEVIGKMLTVGRVPGDLILSSIVISPEDVILGDNEILLTIPIPAMDSTIAQLNKNIVLALYSNSQVQKPPIIVDDIEIYQIKSTVSSTSGQTQQYAIVKTSVESAQRIMPYIPNNSYKILSTNGQPLTLDNESIDRLPTIDNNESVDKLPTTNDNETQAVLPAP